MSLTDQMKALIAKTVQQAGLPPVPNDLPPAHRVFLQALRENVAVRMGQEGDPLDRAVTFRDMAGAGMVRQSSGRVGGGTTITPSPEFDYSPPPAPSGLAVNSGFDILFLSWDNPGLTYNYRTEVWRSAVNALDLESPDTKLVGTANAALYVDNLNGDNTTYYYWIRFVKAIGTQLVYGPFNQTAGTPGAISLDPTYVAEALEGQLNESHLAQSLLDPITLVPTLEGRLDDHDVELSQVAAGVSGNTAAIQTKAEASVVAGLEDEVTAILAEYSVKLDVNGRVVGIGLLNDGNTSQFVVASDSVYFIDPQQSGIAFNPLNNYASVDAVRDTQLVFGYAQVEGYKRFVINVPAYIPEGYITYGHLKNATIEGAQIVNLTVQGAEIEIADIWDLSIGGELKAATFVSGSSGWRITQGGVVELNDATVRGHIEAETGRINSSVIIGEGSYSAAQLIADAQSAGTMADRVAAWTRPNTTLINGNKIFTGDAYVDTLQIRGNAVTVPKGAARTSELYVNSVNWVNVVSLSYNHGFSGTIPGIVLGSISTRDATYPYATVQVRLLYNGAVVAQRTLNGSNDISSARLGSTLMGYTSLFSGTRTLTIQVIASGVYVVGNVAVIGGKR